jgi:hypothetical protein
MKPAVVPIFCGLVLTGISAAGISHWWSVREIIAATRNGNSLPVERLPVDRPPTPVPAVVVRTTEAAPVAVQEPAPVKSQVVRPAPAREDHPAGASEEFYRKLIAEMNELRNQNRDLRDQMAETNRDMMKLEFRVDTHSESFRPLPVSEERIETTLDEGTGVLPPLDNSLDLPVR